jgi:hypothetical protein
MHIQNARTNKQVAYAHELVANSSHAKIDTSCTSIDSDTPFSIEEHTTPVTSSTHTQLSKTL